MGKYWGVWCGLWGPAGSVTQQPAGQRGLSCSCASAFAWWGANHGASLFLSSSAKWVNCVFGNLPRVVEVRPGAWARTGCGKVWLGLPGLSKSASLPLFDPVPHKLSAFSRPFLEGTPFLQSQGVRGEGAEAQQEVAA